MIEKSHDQSHIRSLSALHLCKLGMLPYPEESHTFFPNASRCINTKPYYIILLSPANTEPVIRNKRARLRRLWIITCIFVLSPYVATVPVIRIKRAPYAWSLAQYISCYAAIFIPVPVLVIRIKRAWPLRGWHSQQHVAWTHAYFLIRRQTTYISYFAESKLRASSRWAL